MPTIDDSIRKIDNVICRHLDEIEDTSRGAISQDILEQLTKPDRKERMMTIPKCM